MSHVYVLECSSQGQGPTYYVGPTDSLARRLAQHFLGTGSLWTKKYKPQKVLSVQEGGKALETAGTVQLMILHGWKNVRGGGLCKLEMKEPSFIQEAKDIEKFAERSQKASEDVGVRKDGENEGTLF